jgi:hypothetical protein
MPKEGQVWPLQLVCLLLLVLGLLTFIDPTLFGAGIDREASLLLLGGAVLTGIVLYSPLLAEIFKAGGAGGAITQRLNANATSVADILVRLQAVQVQTTSLTAICETIGGPNPAQPPPTSIIGRLETIRAQMAPLAAVGAAIGTSDDPAQTIQRRLGQVLTSLDAVEATLQTGLKALNERLDSPAAKPLGR